MKYADIVIGNSSSGIIEAPFLKTPTINVGDRQKGRLYANSIINVKVNSNEIVSAIKKVLSADFKRKLKTTKSLYEMKFIQKILSF